MIHPDLFQTGTQPQESKQDLKQNVGSKTAY